MSKPLLEIIGNPDDGYLARSMDYMCFNHGETPEEAREKFMKEITASSHYKGDTFEEKIWHVKSNKDGTFSPYEFKK